MPKPNATDETRDVEMTVITMLLDDENQRPWSMTEIQRAISDPIEAHDAVCSLHACGLLHRTPDDLITPTRAAVRMNELGG